MPVIIFNKHQEYDASWCGEVVSVMRPNILGNPFPIAGRNTREFVIARYENYLAGAMMCHDSPQYREIDRLKGLHKAGVSIGLICCCTPLPCHADVIKRVIEKKLRD